MKITKGQFKKALSTDGILKKGNIELLNLLFFAPDCEATAPQLTEALGYGDKAGPANAVLGNLGKRIAKFLGLTLPSQENSSPGWWQLITNGEQRPDGFVWWLKDELADALIELGLINEQEEVIFPEEVKSGAMLSEGKTKTVNVNVFERNPVARKLCIKQYGAICSVCQFDFKSNYGQIGEGFIHVHHLIEISSIGEEYKVNPINDMRPICPNCHAMLHQKKPPFTVEELQEIIKKTHDEAN